MNFFPCLLFLIESGLFNCYNEATFQLTFAISKEFT